jgi:hypothetical protein
MLALVALTGCFGRNGGAEPTPTASARHTPGESGLAGQRLVLAHGSDVAAGALVLSCTGVSETTGTCNRETAIRPRGRIDVTEPRPVLSVAFEHEPDAVWGIVKFEGRRSDPVELDAGTLVAWRPLVRPGRSELRVLADFGDERFEWLFVVVRR